MLQPEGLNNRSPLLGPAYAAAGLHRRDVSRAHASRPELISSHPGAEEVSLLSVQSISLDSGNIASTLSSLGPR